jgi:RNA polymerase sigma-70 factor (ECF subfamily)
MDYNSETLDIAEASTAELVRQVQSGSNQAFGELVERFEQMVHGVCWQRLRDYAEVQEVAQDVFIKAFEKIGQLREPAAFAGWLRSIAVRQSLNRCTRRPPSVSVDQQVLESVDGYCEPPLANVLASERVDQLHRGLDRLAQLDRSTLIAFYLQGQSLVEMSNEFSAPVGTIKRRLHVARKRLAEELECFEAV